MSMRGLKNVSVFISAIKTHIQIHQSHTLVCIRKLWEKNNNSPHSQHILLFNWFSWKHFLLRLLHPFQFIHNLHIAFHLTTLYGESHWFISIDIEVYTHKNHIVELHSHIQESDLNAAFYRMLVKGTDRSPPQFCCCVCASTVSHFHKLLCVRIDVFCIKYQFTSLNLTLV